MRLTALLGSLFLVLAVGCASNELSGWKDDAGAGSGGDAGKTDNPNMPPRQSADTCGNGVDDNKDGNIDEGCACTLGQTQVCWPGQAGERHVGACKDGKQTCVTDDGEFNRWGPCEGAVLASADTSDDGIDQDCNGQGSQPTCHPTAELCTGGKDEDCDGKIDCADSDCASNAACAPACVPTTESCTNGKDDDCDGKIDCADSNCTANAACAPACVPTAESCTNGKDDDCDGKIDCADTNCAQNAACAPKCVPEWSREWDCGDGKDDDCDGKTDCDDWECWDKSECSCTETCTPGAQRWCDEAQYCSWGKQTCGPDKRWGACHEATTRPAGCGNEYFYDEDCCYDAGQCCEAMRPDPQEWSVGTCQPLSVSCHHI